MGDLQTTRANPRAANMFPCREFQRAARRRRRRAARGAAAFATLARINTLGMIAGAWSGHIGTSFSSLEIMSWLFLNEMRDLDKGDEACDIFFSSKGHDAPALYSVLIGLGLLPPDSLYQLRRLHGLPGHPHVETPYIQANTGSLGMGISKAKGMALANRLAGTPRRIFVLTGDGELQEGQFWESLGSAVTRGLGEIVAIIDHNKIQSDTWVHEVSHLGDLEAKLRAFGWHVGALRRPRRGRARAHVPRARRRDGPAEGGDRRHRQGHAASASWKGPAMKAGELYALSLGRPAARRVHGRPRGAAGDGAMRGSPSWASASVATETRTPQPAPRAARDRQPHRGLRAGAGAAGRTPPEPGRRSTPT